MAHETNSFTIPYSLQVELSSFEQLSEEEESASPDSLSVYGSVLLETFNRVADQRDAARRDLSFAIETVHELKTHISGLNHLLLKAQRELEKREALKCKQKPQAEPTPQGKWIENTWLTEPSFGFLLHDAEKEWENGNPQGTLDLMPRCLGSDDLDFEGHMMCRLLMAAVFHRTHNTDQSMQFAEDVLKRCESHYQKDPIQAGEIAGIAQFLRGKIFMSEGNWTHAFWAFARATSNPRYKAKAQDLKAIAASTFPEEESIPYVASNFPAPLFAGNS